MAGPLDVVIAAHNAFRVDIAAIDAAAVVAAQGGPGIEATVERFQYFNGILERHAAGEEAGLFVQLEKVAPDALGPYEIDHRTLDLAFEGLTKAISALGSVVPQDEFPTFVRWLFALTEVTDHRPGGLRRARRPLPGPQHPLTPHIAERPLFSTFSPHVGVRESYVRPVSFMAGAE